MSNLILEDKKEKGKLMLDKLLLLDTQTQNIIGAKIDALYELQLIKCDKDAS